PRHRARARQGLEPGLRRHAARTDRRHRHRARDPRAARRTPGRRLLRPARFEDTTIGIRGGCTMSMELSEKRRRRKNERNAAMYDQDVFELLQAIDAWRRTNDRQVP